jgi:outer membrane protein OmpA-like peptidoglycan-associated protein
MNLFRTVGVLVLLTAGCGASAPQELVSARTAYDRASHGPASQINPAGLHSAKQTLDVAEHSFSEEGDSQETKDLAYIAERRAQTAEARAQDLQSVKQKEETLARMHAAQTAQVALASEELGRARAQIGAQGQELTSERERREDADRRAAAATAALAGLGTVRQEARGMVITLSGSVLFASNKSDLLPAAQRKLADVADALTKQDPRSKLIVEGYADSQGAAAYNQELSQRRAESVRGYLVSHGISPDRVTAQGFGATRPIADNASAEGRANNRRVEIVVQPSGAVASVSP